MPVVVDFPAGAGDSDRKRRRIEQLRQQLGARDRSCAPTRRAATMSGTVASTAAEATTIWSARFEPRCRPGVELDAARAQEVEFRRRPPLVERAVGAFDLEALVAQDQRKRQHAAPADADRRNTAVFDPSAEPIAAWYSDSRDEIFGSPGHENRDCRSGLAAGSGDRRAHAQARTESPPRSRFAFPSAVLPVVRSFRGHRRGARQCFPRSRQ